MARSTLSSISVSPGSRTHPIGTTTSTVVSLRGEHDMATKAWLVLAIERAAERGGADVVVDLSGVTFMDASTLGALVGCRNRLGSRSRSLELRAPSPQARRVLEVCGLTHLVHPAEEAAVHSESGAQGLTSVVHASSYRSRAEREHGAAASTAEGEPAWSLGASTGARRSRAIAPIERRRGGR